MRAALAQQMLQQLPADERKPSVSMLLRSLPHEERLAILREVVSTLSLSEAAEVNREICEKNREICSDTLSFVEPAERAAIIQEQLITMPAEERRDLLGSLVGLMMKPERSAFRAQLDQLELPVGQRGRGKADG